MTLVLLEIPNDPAAWPEWLERQIVGLDLGDLVDQLQLVVTPPAKNSTLADVCGSKLEDVLQQGLSKMDAVQIRSLLRQPQLLVELQEKVLVDGGSYWRKLPVSVTHSTRVAIQKVKLTQAITEAPQIAPVASTGSPTADKRKSKTWLRQFTAALAVLVAVTAVWMSRNPAAPGWGFQKSGLLSANVSSKEYLNSLADAAKGWFNKQPATVDAMVTRLDQFRQGCDTLLAAPHTQLQEADKAWLLERCNAWKGKIEGHIADLKTGSKNLDQVRQEADATVNKLIDALKTRAAA